MSPQDLGRKSLLLLGSTWGGTVLGMLVSLLIARLLGPTALGGIGWSLGAAGLCMAALLPGFAQAHLKRLAEGQDAGRCVGTMAVIQLALTGAFLAAVGTGWALGGAAGAPELGLVFVFVLASQVSGNFADIFLKVFIAREWIVGYSGIVLGARITRLVVTLAVLLWAPSVTAVAATFPLEGILSCAAAALVLVRQHGVRTRAPTRESLRGCWTYARPFMVTTPPALVQDSVDRFLVGHWAGLAAAGHYHVARAVGGALLGHRRARHLYLHPALGALRHALRGRRRRGAAVLLGGARQAPLPGHPAGLRLVGRVRGRRHAALRRPVPPRGGGAPDPGPGRRGRRRRQSLYSRGLCP